MNGCDLLPFLYNLDALFLPVLFPRRIQGWLLGRIILNESLSDSGLCLRLLPPRLCDPKVHLVRVHEHLELLFGPGLQTDELERALNSQKTGNVRVIIFNKK